MIPRLALPKLEVPRLGLASFRRRLLFRGVFLLLALATLALAVVLLQDEKERSYRAYQQNFGKTQAELVTRLRHPSGQLALLNSEIEGDITPLRPRVLPYAALDVDDPNRALQAVELAGCPVRYPDGSSLCAAVGHNAFAGGFLYLVGSFRAGDLVAREPGEADLTTAHRARIRLEMRGEVQAWIAPFERLSMRGEPLVRGRLIAFAQANSPLEPVETRTLRDFRGWLWQSAACADSGEPADCARRVFYAIRLPVEAFRAAAGQPRTAWPPPDLDRTRVHLQLLPPGDGAPVFDSNAPGAVMQRPLQELRELLLPGETLAIQPVFGNRPPLVLKARDDAAGTSSPMILRLIDRLPVASRLGPLAARETIETPGGDYEMRLAGDARGIDRSLGVIATRMSWYVAAMLGAIVLAWLVIEIGLIRRIAELTRRAAAVSHNVQKDVAQLDVSDLRGKDELGILAGGLADLLQRVKDDVQRERLRAERERDTLEAVGHEILSPLQSLMVLHPDRDDPAHRYVQRMQQAVRVLYGQASPSEALQAAELALQALDLDAFLRTVASNAHFAGIEGVTYVREAAAVHVNADAFSLEDVVTHVLRNADRHRVPGTVIRLELATEEGWARVAIRNQGLPIAADMLDRIFDYGVSGTPAAEGGARRGQGLFVARTYLAKMGGSIVARNEAGGVCFELSLPRAV